MNNNPYRQRAVDARNKLDNMARGIAARSAKLGTTEPVFYEGEQEELLRLQSDIQQLERLADDYRASGQEAYINRMQAEREYQRRLDEAEAARSKRKQTADTLRARLESELEGAIIGVSLEDNDLLAAYAAHRDTAIPRSDGSKYSFHQTVEGVDYTISTEPAGIVYVTEGHDA